MKNREDAWLFVYQSYRDLEQVRQVRNECQQGNKGEESNKALHWT